MRHRKRLAPRKEEAERLRMKFDMHQQAIPNPSTRPNINTPSRRAHFDMLLARRVGLAYQSTLQRSGRQHAQTLYLNTEWPEVPLLCSATLHNKPKRYGPSQALILQLWREEKGNWKAYDLFANVVDNQSKPSNRPSPAVAQAD